MERYNLLLSGENDSKGAIILATRAYKILMENKPEFLHENLGDFYSAERATDIVRVMFDNVCGTHIFGNLIEYFHKSSGGLERAEKGKIYFIQGTNGGRIFTPKHCEGLCNECRNNYGEIALLGISGIISRKSGGIIAGELEKRMVSPREIIETVKTAKELSFELMKLIIMYGGKR